MTKPGRKYLAMLQNAGKVKKVIALAAKDAVSCSVCGHGASKHQPVVPGWEAWSATELTKYFMANVKLGSRKYCCSGVECKECKVDAVQ